MLITFGDKFNALTFDLNLRYSYIIYFIKVFLSFPLPIQLSGQGQQYQLHLFYSTLACVFSGTDDISCTQASFFFFFFHGFARKYIKKSCFEEDL